MYPRKTHRVSEIVIIDNLISRVAARVKISKG